MITNPIMVEGGGRVPERRTGWIRSTEQASAGVNKALARDGTSGKPGTVSAFETVDQLSKGFVGSMLTPERQGKVELSQGIQIADRAMEAISERLQQAKDDLAEIHKMFPPYPHGSEERAEFLNSYKSLRMQIDRLTFPPESDVASQIMGSNSEGEPPAVGQFPVNSGPEGLNLLELDKPVEDLADEELPALIEDLERASGVLYERRMSLKASAGKIFNQETGTEVEFAGLSVEVQEKFAVFESSIGRSKTGFHQDLAFLG